MNDQLQNGVEPIVKETTELSLPHSEEAEIAVLGGLMLMGDSAYDNIASELQASDFWDVRHQEIFNCLARLAETQEPFDPITITDELKTHRKLTKAGGLGYITQLSLSTPSAANISSYARIVREQSTLRQVIGAAGDIIHRSKNLDGKNAAHVLSSAEQSFIDIAEGRPRDKGFLSINGLLKNTLTRIDELYASGGGITGVTTGFNHLDEKTSGLQKADLVIVAARPSMGKTAFALNLVESAVFSSSAPVLIFSMEMPAESLVMRLLASIGRLPLKNIRDGSLTEEDWDRLSNAAKKLSGCKLYIDDTPALTPTDIRARVRKIAREEGENPSMVMLDYLQLMTTNSVTEGRVQQISEISRSLKQVAREFDTPVIALSQLNRGVEQRPNKRPMNSDLRESGAIEQDADLILFIYRDEYYNEESDEKGIAEIIIGKQRNGEVGTVKLQFEGKYTRFNNVAPSYRSPEEQGNNYD